MIKKRSAFPALFCLYRSRTFGGQIRGPAKYAKHTKKESLNPRFAGNKSLGSGIVFLSTGLAFQSDIRDLDILLDGFAHVVDGESGDGDSC